MKSRTGKPFYSDEKRTGVPRNHGIEAEDGTNINGQKEETQKNQVLNNMIELLDQASPEARDL